MSLSDGPVRKALRLCAWAEVEIAANKTDKRTDADRRDVTRLKGSSAEVQNFVQTAELNLSMSVTPENALKQNDLGEA